VMPAMGAQKSAGSKETPRSVRGGGWEGGINHEGHEEHEGDKETPRSVRGGGKEASFMLRMGRRD